MSASRARLHRLPWERVLAAPIGGAWGRVTTRAGLFLGLETGAWPLGWGEVSPLPGFSRETLETCDAALAALPEELLAALVATSPGPAREVLLDGLGLPNAARFGLETALLDAEGRGQRRSIAESLAPSGSRRAVPLSALLGFATPEGDLLRAAEFAQNAGFSCVKVKLGGAPFPVELAALRALRAFVGPRVALRLDPNGAFPAGEVAERLAALAPLEPAWIEEPVPLHELLAAPDTPIPWAADESLVWPELAERLLAAPPPSCRAIVLKPALLGGLVRARALGLRARARGLAVVVTHLLDGPVAHAAACELALSLEDTAAAGLAPHALTAAFGASIAQLGPEPFVRPADGPGLGLRFDPRERVR